jgi:transcriptional regulator with XRE-family HTH domain
LTVRYQDIADRLRAFRLGSDLSAEEIARRAGISRTALYRLEKGELVKIETLERVADLLEVSVTTLLGVGIEYIASPVSYFERLRQIEAAAEHITALAGPISFLLSSDTFEQTLDTTLRESVADDDANRPRILEDIAKITAVLRERKQHYHQRQPSIVNLMSGLELARFVRDGMVGRFNLPEAVRAERRELARREIEHFIRLIEAGDMGVQIGVAPETLPHSGFQVFRQPDREILTTSPFRLGEHPNVQVGVAMITSAPEALTLHKKVIVELWRRALKGGDAARFLRNLLTSSDQPATHKTPTHPSLSVA